MVAKKLPTILCLHGMGTSASIFEAQTRNLRHSLRSRFRFVFINGAHVSGAGPGVVPVYVDCGPFYSWFPEGLDYADPAAMTTEFHSVNAHIEKSLAEQDVEVSEIVAVLGFSQGTIVTSMLLYQAQFQNNKGRRPSFSRPSDLPGGRRPSIPRPCDLPGGRRTSIPHPCDLPGGRRPSIPRPCDLPGGRRTSLPQYHDLPGGRRASLPTADLGGAKWTGIRFGVLISGAWKDGVVTAFMGQKLLLPSVHVHGLQDAFLDNARMLRTKMYQATSSDVYEFDGGHNIPGSKADIDKLTALILRLNRKTEVKKTSGLAKILS